MLKTAIVIPCYNEEKRLDIFKIDELLQLVDVPIYFANDGSTDGTLTKLNRIAEKYPERCFVLNFELNQGKAATIYRALNHLNNQFSYDYIGYFDADFSTPVEEIVRLKNMLEQLSVEMLFGSRIKLLNSGIDRKVHRHYIGRIILTILDSRFRLSIYDTQCGAKFLSANLIRQVLDRPFLTSWLFDVEIFVRIKQLNLLHMCKEVPISNWRDVEGSKLSWKSSLHITKEIFTLLKNY